MPQAQPRCRRLQARACHRLELVSEAVLGQPTNPNAAGCDNNTTPSPLYVSPLHMSGSGVRLRDARHAAKHSHNAAHHQSPDQALDTTCTPFSMSNTDSSRLEVAQKVFATLDKAGTGSLPLSSLAQVLSELDIDVPNDELVMLEDYIDDGTGKFDLLGLSKLLDRQDERDEVQTRSSIRKAKDTSE